MASIQLENRETLKLVNELLKPDGIEIKKIPEVYHVLDFLIKNIGIDKIREQVVQSLDLRLSVHYGCHYTKPSKLLATEKPDDPQYIHEILEVLGIEIQPYLEERLCCGAALRFVNNDLALEVLKEKLTSISAVKPDGVAIVCPTCFEAMDRGQKILSRKEEKIEKTEFFFIEELLAKSMGFEV
jgi:heterodisulfide reductase subunit B